MKQKNLLLVRVLQNFDSLTTVIFGLLLEKPQTFEEVSLLLRIRKSQVEKALEKLSKLRVIEEYGGIIVVNADAYKEKQLEHYRWQIQNLRSRLRRAQNDFFSRCEKCGMFLGHTETNLDAELCE